jgi:hypothetical protein
MNRMAMFAVLLNYPAPNNLNDVYVLIQLKRLFDPSFGDSGLVPKSLLKNY